MLHTFASATYTSVPVGKFHGTDALGFQAAAHESAGVVESMMKSEGSMVELMVPERAPGRTPELLQKRQPAWQWSPMVQVEGQSA